MKIVQFKDGTYAVRKWFFIYWYLDLQNPKYWWPKSEAYFKRWCVASSIKTIELALSDKDARKNFLKDKGTPLE